MTYLDKDEFIKELVSIIDSVDTICIMSILDPETFAENMKLKLPKIKAILEKYGQYAGEEI